MKKTINTKFDLGDTVFYYYNGAIYMCSIRDIKYYAKNDSIEYLIGAIDAKVAFNPRYVNEIEIVKNIEDILQTIPVY